MNFCQPYHMATYIFQAFVIFSKPTGDLVELLQYGMPVTTINFMQYKFGTDQSDVQFVHLVTSKHEQVLLS